MRSIATTSLGSSTTQITVRSRRGSRQIRHSLVLGDVAADRAEPHLVLDLGQRVGEPAYVGRVGREQVERDPLGALGTDAGQPPELVDEVLDHAFVHPRSLCPEPDAAEAAASAAGQTAWTDRLGRRPASGDDARARRA